jgi:excisionase family DNA binding protein
MSNKAESTISLSRLFTIKQVAAHLGFSCRQVRRWIERKQLVAVPFGRSWRIQENDLALFIATQKGK